MKIYRINPFASRYLVFRPSFGELQPKGITISCVDSRIQKATEDRLYKLGDTTDRSQNERT